MMNEKRYTSLMSLPGNETCISAETKGGSMNNDSMFSCGFSLTHNFQLEAIVVYSAISSRSIDIVDLTHLDTPLL